MLLSVVTLRTRHLPDVDADELRWIISGLAHVKLTTAEGPTAAFRISNLHRALRELKEKTEETEG